jgi:integrase
MFRVEMTVLDDGERMPLLYRTKPYIPVLTALLYIAVRRRYQKSRTLLRDVRALQALYHWCEDIRQEFFDLDSHLLRGNMLSASDIEAFARWMRVGRPHRSMPQAGETVVAFPHVLKPVSLQNTLGAVRLYLRWAAQRYRPERGRYAKAESFRSQTLLLDETFNAVRLRGRTPELEKGLEPERMRRLLELSDPRHAENPFRARLRNRNALILMLFYETAIRRGELLKLKVEDLLKDDDGKCFISVCRRPDDLTDTRRTEPGQKTDDRILAVHPLLHDALLQYVREERRPKCYLRSRQDGLGELAQSTTEAGFPSKVSSKP